MTAYLHNVVKVMKIPFRSGKPPFPWAELQQFDHLRSRLGSGVPRTEMGKRKRTAIRQLHSSGDKESLRGHSPDKRAGKKVKVVSEPEDKDEEEGSGEEEVSNCWNSNNKLTIVASPARATANRRRQNNGRR